ncbi:hydrolase [Capsulimonas corticalis]|uniref:Hydrolase n=1 Tax=Capsulimonas corticalis TaxID=2219043 RepID=A0A402CW53_9BACT|nr:hydrolase [Capsulimonas corticalis]BDI34026.1 hydrolase [Capsulimonas corticalis]
MASQIRRDPATDALLTPENAALVLIDYQAPQFNTVRSMDSGLLLANVVALAKTAKLFGLPIVLSTVGVASGANPDTVPTLLEALPGVPSIDRTSINAWEDAQFVAAVRATGRKKLIMGALWTEVCLAFPALDALKEGFEVFAVADAVGGTSIAAHETALQRVYQAGAQPVSWIGVLCELQRDWARTSTADGMVQISSEHGGSWGTEIALKRFLTRGAA